MSRRCSFRTWCVRSAGSTAPAGGGGPAGAIMVASHREEVKTGRIRRDRGGGRSRRNSLDGLARDVGDVAAAEAEIGKLAVGQAAQLGNGFPVAAPVAIV